MARWGRGPNRAFGHVHNWKLHFDNWSEFTQDAETGFWGLSATRSWRCVRGGKVKHIMPYHGFNVDFDGNPIELKSKVFVVLSGSPYVVEDPY